MYYIWLFDTFVYILYYVVIYDLINLLSNTYKKNYLMIYFPILICH